MTNFEKALFDVNFFCEKERITYAIIGGIALIAYGIAKTTEDIDITLMLDLEDIEKTGKKILTHFDPFHPNPLTFFQTNFVLPVIHRETKIGIDFAAGLTGFDASVIKRGVKLKFHTLTLPFASIEDIIIYKLFAARGKDYIDLKEIANDYKEKIDRKYLNKLLLDFYKLDREDMKENFNKIFN
jgi:hypothetical protein